MWSFGADEGLGRADARGRLLALHGVGDALYAGAINVDKTVCRLSPREHGPARDRQPERA
jgi:hypothetical protein